MPTSEPNNDLPTSLSDDARDDRTAAAVLTDEQLDETPGGGGLGTRADAQDPLSGATAARSGTAPNAPIDVPVPGQTLDENGLNPSATRATQAEVAEDKFPDANPLGTTAVGGDR